MKKEEYIERSLNIFKRWGLMLPMDELAEKIGVTRKTLYNNFESKEVLLRSCLGSFAAEVHEWTASMHDSSSPNAIEGFIHGLQQFREGFRGICENFMNDLSRLYPVMGREVSGATFGEFRNAVLANMEKGQKEGLYRKDLDAESVADYFSYCYIRYFHEKLLPKGNASPQLFFKMAADLHLRGIASEKGLEYLNKRFSNEVK